MRKMTKQEIINTLARFIFENRSKFGGDISAVSDENGVVECLLKNGGKTAQNENDGVKIGIDEICDTVKGVFAHFGYNRRFDRTETKKRITTALKTADKGRRLYPLQIIYAFKLYLAECYAEDREEQFVRLASTFMSNMVYDYAEQSREVFESKMGERYGTDWRKVKFCYK